MKRSHELDMTNGPIFTKVLLFSLPLMFSSILQLLFNAADTIVVGKFAGSIPLAAVGSTGSLINLLVNTFVGISTGVNVLVAKYYGAKNNEDISRCVHTSITLSAILGLLVCLIVIVFSSPILKLMNVDPEVLPLSILYLQIYALGTPATMVYNFGAAVLRAIGDTDRPLRFLIVSGVINVILNLVTVIWLHMSVAGVAIATVVSQYVSAFLILRCLAVSEGPYRVMRRKLGLNKDMVGEILKIGLPAGLQGSIFSISNMTIQSAINSFGTAAMAGNSAGSNIDGFIYVCTNAFYHAALSFTSQNIGAKRYDRLNKILFSCVIMVILVGNAVSILVYTFGPQLLSLYISKTDPQREAVIAAGMTRLTYVGLSYFLCGLMEVGSGILRGFGKSWTSLIIATIGSCIFRILWISFVFPAYPSFNVIFLCYPISWIITPAALYFAIFLTRRKIDRSVRTAG